MGPYFFTMLVNLIGPVKNVRGRSSKVFDYRQILSGPRKSEKIEVETPTSFMADLEFYSGAIIQSFLSFDVINHKRNHMEFYGTKGSIIGPDPNMFGGPIFASFTEGGEWKEYSTENMKIGKINIFNQSGRSNESPTNANYRGVVLAEMISCIYSNKKHRCNGELALHVLDMIDSTIRSAKISKPIELSTNCEQPKYFPEEEISELIK